MRHESTDAAKGLGATLLWQEQTCTFLEPLQLAKGFAGAGKSFGGKRDEGCARRLQAAAHTGASQQAARVR
jgi:hypothetical protein